MRNRSCCFSTHNPALPISLYHLLRQLELPVCVRCGLNSHVRYLGWYQFVTELSNVLSGLAQNWTVLSMIFSRHRLVLLKREEILRSHYFRPSHLSSTSLGHKDIRESQGGRSLLPIT